MSSIGTSSKPIQTLETDVVVIGGGVAGCLAVLGATQAGAKVVVIDKGGLLERAGSVAGGTDHFSAVLEEGPEWDTPEFLMKYMPALVAGVADIEAIERLIRGLKPMVELLESLGVDFRDPENPDVPYYRHRSFGMPGTYTINFDGTDFKHVIGRSARRTGAKILERTMVADILMDDGRPRGAVAFNIRTGEVYVILAKAVVVATGDANRLGKNASGHAFDSWHFPYNAGSGRAMALRSGARLANMEFIDCTVSPKGYSSQGLNAFVGAGAHFVNSLGERFMFKYHPSAEKGRRSDIINGWVTETLEGRGPIFCDCTHLPKDEVTRLANTLGIDRPALPTFFEQKNIDLTKEPFEICVTEIASVRGGQPYRGSGVHIDRNSSSSAPGIFSGGDCSTTSAGISGATVMGHIAGQSAAQFATSHSKIRPLSSEEKEQIREMLFQPLQLKDGVTSLEFEDRVRSIVTDYVGFRREENRMQEGLKLLRELRSRENEISAVDYHGVMRVNEARGIQLNAEALAVSALERKESRGGSAHVRVDYPETDNEAELRVIMVEMVDNELKASSKPTGLDPNPIQNDETP
jgi:succinate dehydrogenase/fumarate reductase flavoprotein subunit